MGCSGNGKKNQCVPFVDCLGSNIAKSLEKDVLIRMDASTFEDQ
jgi:hypothetical protein